MAQAMEAWLIADLDALADFYGQGFNPNSIPRVSDVETIEKALLESSLKAATRNTRKGKYHKSLHAPKLLAKLNEKSVRQKARHCDRLFTTLTAKIE